MKLCNFIGHDWPHDDGKYFLLTCRRCRELGDPGLVKAMRVLRLIILVVFAVIMTAVHLGAADYQVSALVTGYTGKDPGCTGVTKTGVQTADHPDGIAVDGTHIPVGSTITVPGYRDGAPTIADDVGGAMRKDWRRGVVHIDLRFAERADALQWGRQQVTITVHTP